MPELPAAVSRADTVVRPMVRVARGDILPVAWRVAVEFARPRRDRRPLWGVAVALLPLMVVFVVTSGTYHWQRVAVLSVDRRGRKEAWRGVWVCLLAAAVFSPGGAVLAWACGGRGAVDVLLGAGALMACSCVAVYVPRLGDGWGRRREPLPRTVGPVSAQWVAGLAAAAPGIDAITTVFAPHLRALVPRGEVVSVVAATNKLAHVYARAGFARTTRSPRRLFVVC